MEPIMAVWSGESSSYSTLAVDKSGTSESYARLKGIPLAARISPRINLHRTSSRLLTRYFR